MKPLIGITCNYSREDLGSPLGLGVPGQDYTLLANDYVTAVERAGGLPLLLPFTRDIDTLLELVARCDGILISGGDDVAPALYGEDVSAEVTRLEPVRDRQESLLLAYLLEASSQPVLGICRGCQILNVAAGGTLHQDLTSLGKHHTLLQASRDAFAHRVQVQEGSRLADILGETCLYTNSYHHQAVKEPAAGFRVSGRTADGVIEALEGEGDRFLLGVQWHPEMTPSCPLNQRIFQAFLAACR